MISISASLLLTITCIICFCLYKFWNYFRICYYLLKLPGPRPVPIIGNALLFKRNAKDYFQLIHKLFTKYGEIVSIWLGPLPLVIVSNAELGKTLISSTKFVDKSWVLKYVTQDFGESVGVSTGSTWKRNIKLIRSGLNPKILNSFLPVFNEKSEILVKQLEKQLNDSKPFKTHKYFIRTSLDSVYETVLGLKISSQTNNEMPLFDIAISLTRVIVDRLFKIWLFPNFLFKRSKLYTEYQKNLHFIYKVVEDVIEERKKQINDSKLDSNEDLTLLDFLIYANKHELQLTDEQLRNETIFIIAAGYVTVSISLGYTSLCLGARKEIQDKVYNEIFSIFGTSDRPVQLEDLNKLSYLEMVIKESLRLFPPVPHIEREAIADIKLENGKIIPKGTQLIISLYHMNHDPKIWENAEEFNPDRFSEEKLSQKLLSFGGGQRTCAGMQYAMMFMKIVLVNILRKYEIHTDLDINNLNLTINVILMIIGGHLIRITERKRPELLHQESIGRPNNHETEILLP